MTRAWTDCCSPGSWSRTAIVWKCPGAALAAAPLVRLSPAPGPWVRESPGYRVEGSRSCAEAYEKCRRERFAAITLDLVLPDGPGWEALARIRSLEHHRRTPVVVSSACEPEDLDVAVDVQAFLT